MNILRKLQKLPEPTRKIILWLIVIIIGLALFIFWLKIVQEKLKNFPKEELKERFKTPFQEKLEEMPKIEMPEISEEELENLEETNEEK